VPSFQEFETDLGQPDRRGYSALRLCDVAKRYGAHAATVQTDLQRLESIREPFVWIALLETSHFVTVSAIGSSEVHVIDPPDSYDMRRGLFEELWTGNAIVISRAPLAQLSVPNGSIWRWVGPLIASVSLAIIGVYTYRRILRSPHGAKP
jgi:ABC-type bacteriocin/lantibiotic exporter with double-glycine peptidase domain